MHKKQFINLKIWLSVLITLCLLLYPALLQAKNNLPVNAKETNAAWECFNKSNWQGAREHSDFVINHFSKLATGMHDMLASRIKDHKAEIPPIGSVTDAQKKETFKYGLMNDVATCYYIKARSLYNLYRKSKADNKSEAELSKLRTELKDSYDGCIALPYARCWDPQGWFWSPAEGIKQDIILKKVDL